MWALRAQANGGDEAAIRAAIAAQAAAWNRADIPAFMQTYEDSPETTFIGSTVRKGYEPILERYRQNYTTPEQMGTLTFNDVDVRLLPGACGTVEYAVVTGQLSSGTRDEGRSEERRRHLFAGVAQGRDGLEDCAGSFQLRNRFPK